MFRIEGQCGTALCYASVFEEEAIAQIRRMCDQEFARNAKIRIMPDVHAGEGCTIGTTMTVTDQIVPNIVGVDIGCGMYTVNLGKTEIDFLQMDAAAHRIPSGADVRETPAASFDLKRLRCFSGLTCSNHFLLGLGTLGGGNHFIEIDAAESSEKYLVIHSGSRSLGYKVAKHYQRLAVDLCRGKIGWEDEAARLMSELRTQGRGREIPEAVNALKQNYLDHASDVPDDLCYLTGQYLEDYLHDVKICQEYARLSREIMAREILEMTGMHAVSAFHTIHNYIDTDEMILRKGAVAAHRGEQVLIPINMRDGSILAVGKGNADWNYSAPHGAGRVLSRRAAKENLDMEAYRKDMEGIYTTSVCPATIDESPQAYKSLNDIIGVVRDSVDVLEVLKPIYNFKASN